MEPSAPPEPEPAEEVVGPEIDRDALRREYEHDDDEAMPDHPITPLEGGKEPR